MAKLYLSAQQGVLGIIRKHFPPAISNRFTVRSTSDIWKPGEDKVVFDMVRNNKESLHVLFDMVELFEIPYDLPAKIAELQILRAFKQAIIDGRVSIDVLPDYTTNEDIRRQKKVMQDKKRRDVIESIKEARDNPMTPEEAAKHIAATTKKANKLKEELIINENQNGIIR